MSAVPLVINWLTGQQMPIYNQTATLGSVVFAGTGGVYTDDNAQFFWDDTNHVLGIATNTPASIGSGTGIAIGGPQKIADNPLGNPVATTSTLVLNVGDVGGGTGYEYAAVFGITTTHNTGSTAPNKVAGYFAATNNNASGGNIWSLNSVNTLGASSPSTVASSGYEIDVNNLSGTARNYSNLGAPSYGLQVTGASTSVNTAAILISCQPSQPQWYAGIVFNNSRSGQSATYGIDLAFDASNTFATAAIRIPNNQVLGWNNSSGGLVTGLKLDGSNIWQVGGGDQVNINGGNLTGTSVAMSVGSLTGLGATGTASISGNPNGGIVTLSPSGAGISATGLFSISWPTAFPTVPNLVVTPMNGTGTWSNVVTFLITSQLTNNVQVQWANNGINLTGGSTYKFSYVAFGI